ncbi:MAG: hypothetical protein QXU48_02545 [Thermoplasmata archaeon]
MCAIIVKAYMVEVKQKDFVLLRGRLRSTAEDEENMIVNMEELRSAFYEMDTEIEDTTQRFLEELMEKIPENVEYVWFHL